MSERKRDSKEVVAWFKELADDFQRAQGMTDGQLLTVVETTSVVPDEIVHELVVRGYRDILLLYHCDDDEFCLQIKEVTALAKTIRSRINWKRLGRVLDKTGTAK